MPKHRIVQRRIPNRESDTSSIGRKIVDSNPGRGALTFFTATVQDEAREPPSSGPIALLRSATCFKAHRLETRTESNPMTLQQVRLPDHVRSGLRARKIITLAVVFLDRSSRIGMGNDTWGKRACPPTSPTKISWPTQTRFQT